jgi:hypothetical protein
MIGMFRSPPLNLIVLLLRGEAAGVNPCGRPHYIDPFPISS